jgi:hypothetical protein
VQQTGRSTSNAPVSKRIRILQSRILVTLFDSAREVKGHASPQITLWTKRSRNLRAIRLRELLTSILQKNCGAPSPSTSGFGHDCARQRTVVCRIDTTQILFRSMDDVCSGAGHMKLRQPFERLGVSARDLKIPSRCQVAGVLPRWRHSVTRCRIRRACWRGVGAEDASEMRDGNVKFCKFLRTSCSYCRDIHNLHTSRRGLRSHSCPGGWRGFRVRGIIVV